MRKPVNLGKFSAKQCGFTGGRRFIEFLWQKVLARQCHLWSANRFCSTPICRGAVMSASGWGGGDIFIGKLRPKCDQSQVSCSRYSKVSWCDFFLRLVRESLEALVTRNHHERNWNPMNKAIFLLTNAAETFIWHAFRFLVWSLPLFINRVILYDNAPSLLIRLWDYLPR